MSKEDLTPASPRQQRPALSPEQREKQLIALAVDLSERRLRDGNATSAEILYWLNRADPNRVLERENLKLQGDLLRAKVDTLNAERKMVEGYDQVINAMKSYSPTQSDDVIEGDFREV